jgi:hypothetical protein
MWIAGAAVCVLAAGTGIAVTTAFASAPVAAVDEQPGSTATIEQGTLSGAKTVSGVLDYADTRDLQAGIGGILTHLPTPGSEIGQGGELYRVDNTPVTLFLGDLPRGAPSNPGWTTVRTLQLQQNLKALGFYDGEPDGEYGWATVQAVRDWQKATGQSGPAASISAASCSHPPRCG